MGVEVEQGLDLVVEPEVDLVEVLVVSVEKQEVVSVVMIVWRITHLKIAADDPVSGDDLADPIPEEPGVNKIQGTATYKFQTIYVIFEGNYVQNEINSVSMLNVYTSRNI